MSRRRLRLVSSSDEDDEPPPRVQYNQQPVQLDEAEEDIEVEVELSEPTLNFETVTLNSTNPNTRSSGPIQLEISDEELINIPDVTPPSPPSVPVSSFRNSDYCPISGILGGLGLRLRREWLDSCVRCLEGSLPGFTGLDDAAKAKLCFEQFLYGDMNCVGAGVLPENVHDMHLVDLAGPFVLQVCACSSVCDVLVFNVDEIVNISCPLKGRYQNAPSTLKRCLKLSMTDGVQRVFGMEYRPIKDLEVLAPAGLKVAICNVNVRHGLLMLVPEVFEVLGGLVEELEAARQRLVNEVNKPPRGKRTGVIPPLAARATLAAWPPDPVSVPGHDNSSMQHATISVQADAQGTASGVSRSDRTAEDSAAPMSRVNAEANESSAGPKPPSAAPVHRESAEHNPSSAAPIHRESAGPSPSYAASTHRDMDEHIQHNASSSSAVLECFLTGVKGFQYKQRTIFELHVYVDDGSLISEILIDHEVVQKAIGHSPEDVTAALASSDMNKVSNMKETMKQFQIFLVNFEISEASPLPIAIEMNQGCPIADAWLLLTRVKSYTSTQPSHSKFEPINISP
ncbi:hypothetical protein RJ640_014041 [Escallonia rubra]|uniref:RecQ-mediated genome instability protein 1 n=1 Tax=Escallonia rubra TaxID=112253 RepID=A0AA88UH33_9ASTE|nr:hypothetical protein RJ640_014041 [Escallonia rubra]